MAKLDKYGLNSRQRKFADRFLLCGNAAEAYIYAGYKSKDNDSRKIADRAAKIKNTNSVKLYIEMRQAEYRAEAEKNQQASVEEIIEVCTKVLRGDEGVVDGIDEDESESTMGASSSKKTKYLSKRYAIDTLIKLFGADKNAANNQSNIIIEEVD
jgi:phage terminase small subunit